MRKCVAVFHHTSSVIVAQCVCVCSAVILIQRLDSLNLHVKWKVRVGGGLRSVICRGRLPLLAGASHHNMVTISPHAVGAQVNSGRNIVRMALAPFPGAVQGGACSR